MTQQYFTREDAIAAGEIWYFTGKACKHGHIAPRRCRGRKCKECSRIQSTKWAHANPEARRVISTRHMRKAGKLPVPGKPPTEGCEICGESFTKVQKHLDHCHKTGKFRGWLCRHCNPSIGLLGDTAADLFKAYTYLKRFEDSLRLP